MRVVLLSLLLLLFPGCSYEAAPAKKQLSTYPAWINNPCLGGVTGSVGSSLPHFKGPAYQRKLAISRALDELALQKGVEIDLVAKREQTSKNDNVRSTSDIQSEQRVTNSKVTAHIEATYTDPQTKELFVWMVLD
ncbi:hypothetical protein [Sulfurimonas sp. HSL-1716]|uniref:hypothetical protein n=1 Tax=Hydrocurvibacter sulfurireducens TaxID=3131937 RepID=UPI0031F91D68